jgi:hypothetical protein
MTDNEAKAMERAVDEEIKRARCAAIDAFNSVYADCLEAQATLARPSKGDTGEDQDAAIDKATAHCEKMVGKVIETQAITKYQIDRKFEILRGLLREDAMTEDQDLALLESLRTDVLAAVGDKEFLETMS